ncbi:EF-P 5-aminopentanol modification-associated protein YfmH [Marinicrinis sediminis]|uniref:EF-P 5-aminopentanol modification-associated protein YfmH n=1 Tax=Marinicrinis sediminis TaxID=1652465 RepID=A0ABW5R4P5_9BACL
MQVKHYDLIQEKLYVETLANGLTVYVLPKKGFQKTYATFATRYGSIDRDFQVEGKERVQVPDGIAHFLEHKMFEEPKGDVFAQFASQGASANAFTSFDRTVYLFSSTNEVFSNIETLLNFVQNPYFTDENVEKEKGIIGQEINMYQDNPDWRVYFGLIGAMYQKHPVYIDIAGTIPSITAITKEMLYECYRTFYHPTNMALFVVGAVDPEEVMLLVRDNQNKKTFGEQGKIARFYPDEPLDVREKMRKTKLPVSMPKCLIGFKENQTAKGRELHIKDIQMRIVMDVLFSSSSDLYQKLYEEKIITDQFGSEYRSHPDYAFSIIGGDTPDADLLVKRLKEEIESVLREGIREADFERSRRKKIGGYLRMLNAPESIANQFTDYAFKGMDFFDTLTIYEELQLEQVNACMRAHFDWDQMAISIVESEAVSTS